MYINVTKNKNKILHRIWVSLNRAQTHRRWESMCTITTSSSWSLAGNSDICILLPEVSENKHLREDWMLEIMMDYLFTSHEIKTWLNNPVHLEALIKWFLQIKLVGDLLIWHYFFRLLIIIAQAIGSPKTSEILLILQPNIQRFRFYRLGVRSTHLYYFKNINHIYLLCVYSYVCTYVRIYKSVNMSVGFRTCRSWFFPSAMWLPGSKFRTSSGVDSISFHRC